MAQVRLGTLQSSQRIASASASASSQASASASASSQASASSPASQCTNRVQQVPACGGSLRSMEQPQAEWKQCVRNTFLHFEAENEEEKKLVRSVSDSSLHSSVNSGSSTFSDSSLNVNSSVTSGSSGFKARDQALETLRHQEGSGSESSRSHYDWCSSASLPGTENLGHDWSKGSESHHLGKCDPCAFHTRPAGCTNGSDCTFCHTCPAAALQTKRKANRKIEKRRGQEGKTLLNL